MLTTLWDNDGVLVDTEGLYFRATQTVLKTVGIDLTAERFKEISLRRGESTFALAVEHGVQAAEISRLRAERDQIYADLLDRSRGSSTGPRKCCGRYKDNSAWES